MCSELIWDSLAGVRQDSCCMHTIFDAREDQERTLIRVGLSCQQCQQGFPDPTSLSLRLSPIVK